MKCLRRVEWSIGFRTLYSPKWEQVEKSGVESLYFANDQNGTYTISMAYPWDSVNKKPPGSVQKFALHPLIHTLLEFILVQSVVESQGKTVKKESPAD